MAAASADIEMTAFWSGTAARLLGTAAERIAADIASQQIRHHTTTQAEQATAWQDSIATLQNAFKTLGDAASSWFVLLEYPMLRLGMRADAIILTDRAILVLEFKRNAADLAALRQVEDYALNLLDFHSASRSHPIVPVLVSAGARLERNQTPLLWHALCPVQQTPPEALPRLLRWLAGAIPQPSPALNIDDWLAGLYRPVPSIIEAARMTYARHGVAEIVTARADQKNLRETTDAIATALATARAAGQKIILFVTGIPGAGKTLCGLNIAFSGRFEDTIFLTGNPTLVHVLRAALVRDAVQQGQSRRGAEHRLKSNIQALPHFRNDHVKAPLAVPPERIAVIDEAQRCWSADYAIRKTVDKPVRLNDSEPGHLLDIMARHTGFAAVICLVGSGQEIHDGEGGLAEWGEALARRPDWVIVAPPDVMQEGADHRWCLGRSLRAAREPLLHLGTAIRQIRSAAANDWVDAVLRGDRTGAAHITANGAALPFLLTRDLAAARAAVREAARGTRRAGLLASSGGKRLRAAGLGSELPHMDADAVAHWFLDHYPADIRGSDALEQIATEFSCQGLELDVVLLCWDADLIRVAGRQPWRARRFRGTAWQDIKQPEAIANQVNTYRVLLTRARYETVIFVPHGEAEDPTRLPGTYDEIATFLAACGARPLPAQEPYEPDVTPATVELLV